MKKNEGLVDKEIRPKKSNKNMEFDLGEDFLNSIIDNIPHMIFVKEAKSLKFVKFNKAGENFLGFSNDNLIGKSDYDLFPKSQADFFTKKDRLVLSNGCVMDIPEEEINTKEKGLRILNTKKVPLLDEQGIPKYLLGISEDITEIRRSESKIKTLNRTRSEFLNLVSHELKTPLTPMLVHLDLLLDEDLGKINKNQKQSLHVIGRNIDRLQRLIVNLLEISRIESGRIRIKIQNTDLNKIITCLVDELQPIAKERGILIKKNLKAIPKLKVDSEKIRECVANYLNNAIKFTKRGHIVISTRVDDDRVKVIVEDTGIGIKKSEKGNLFKRFYHTKVAQEGKVHGIGLGLYSVKLMVYLHEGNVGADSRYGKGSKFWFSLPLHKAKIIKNHGEHEIIKLIEEAET